MPDLSGFIEFLKSNYLAYGYLIVLFGSYLENTVLMGLIFPGGLLIVLGGVFAAQGDLSLPLVILMGWIGMFCGSSTDYFIGRAGLWRVIEKTRLKRWVEPGLKEARLLLEEKGAQSIYLAHCLGQIRTFAALTAGIVRMPYRKFAFYEAGAALLWNILYVGAGYLFGQSLGAVDNIFKIGAGVALVIGAISYFSWKRGRAKRLQAELAEAGKETPETDTAKAA
jgi:membrane protein DedA with SNARE-associated domain